MSVIGIDFGNESCYVATAKAGGIETIANDYSLRATPSCVAFAGKKRLLGVAAKNQQLTNLPCTITDFKRFLGKKYDDINIVDDIQNSAYQVERRADGGIGIRVNYLDQSHVFSPEQITAMLFTKLKESATAELNAHVNDCVITIPFFATNAERKALLDAAQIAGLNVLRLLNEPTAIALSYGFYKVDLPAVDEKPRSVIFVDFGYSQLQVSVFEFNAGKLRMACSTWDEIGGRDFDRCVADYFVKEFQTKYKINTKTNPRAYLRLLAEVEKLKKQMSANSTQLPLNIECFMNDIDVKGFMTRAKMEEICDHLLKRIERTLIKCFGDAKLSYTDIHAVEIVGGSTRIPAVKQLIESIFKHSVTTTLNQDEAVSRGAALQCAIMSPAVRVRDFSVTDIQNYSVKISWDGDNNPFGEMEIFPFYHVTPFSRLVTLFKRDPFNVRLTYDIKAFAGRDAFIGEWRIFDIKPSANGESQEVKIKVRIDQNGIVFISNANVIEKGDPLENNEIAGEQKDPTGGNSNDTNGETGTSEKMDIDNNENLNRSNEPQTSTTTATNDTTTTTTPTSPTSSSSSSSSHGGGGGGGQGWAQRVKGWFSGSGGTDDAKKATKKKNKITELSIDGKTHGYSNTELSLYIQQEKKMINNDKDEMARIDARNALEEYVYDMRDKMSTDGQFNKYTTEKDANALCDELKHLENWLYEDGEDCTKEIYREKLQTLHTKTDAIKNRCYAYEEIPKIFAGISEVLHQARKVISDYRDKIPKYDHITETEILNLTEAADKTEMFVSLNFSKLSKISPTVDPPITPAEARHECDRLRASIDAVLNRPKPKPATPPAAPTDTQATTTTGNNETTDATGDPAAATTTANAEKMDIES